MSDQYTTPVDPRHVHQARQRLPLRSPRSPISHPVPRRYPPPVTPPQAPPAPPPPARKRVVLLACAAVAFAAAAVLAVLYIGADGERDAAVALLDQRNAQLADARARAAATADARVAAQARNSDLETEKANLAACVDAVRHYLWDGLEGDARNTALDAMFTACQ